MVVVVCLPNFFTAFDVFRVLGAAVVVVVVVVITGFGDFLVTFLPLASLVNLGRPTLSDRSISSLSGRSVVVDM